MTVHQGVLGQACIVGAAVINQCRRVDAGMTLLGEHATQADACVKPGMFLPVMRGQRRDDAAGAYRKVFSRAIRNRVALCRACIYPTLDRILASEILSD